MLSTPLVLGRLSEDQMRAQQPEQEHGKGFPGQVFAPTNLIAPLVADTTAAKEEALHPWTRSPITGRKLWWSHCGCHSAVPKRAAANGSQPNCAKSSSRDGNRCLALVPKPCNMTGLIKPGSISIAWYILSPGSTLIATSAWYLWAPGAGPRQKGENHAEAWPPASTRRTLGRYPFHTMRRWPTQDRWIHSPGDKETVTIHFPRRSTHRVTWKPCGHGDHSFHPR